MSLLLMESADLPTVAGDKWSAVTATFAQTVDGRTCWSMPQNAMYLTKNLSVSQESATITVGLRYRITVASSNAVSAAICEFYGIGGTVLHLRITNASTGAIQVNRGAATVIGTSAAGVLPLNTWVYLEFQVTCHDTAGAVTVKADGTTVLTLTNVDTRDGGADALIDKVVIGAQQQTSGGVAYVRDIVIMNDAGTALNGPIGPAVVEARLATAAGDLAAWTPNTGANYAAVDDPGVNDGDTTYVEATTAVRDTYTVADLAAVGSNIQAVQAHAVARYNASPLNVATTLRRSSTNSDGTAATPTGSYTSKALTIWETDPVAAGAWTVSNFNSTEFGVVSS